MDPFGRQAEQLAALGHPVRLGILRLVVQGGTQGTPAGEVQRSLGIPASTLSHHLSTLAAADLVRAERQGTSLRYRADFGTLRALTNFLWEDCCRGDLGHNGAALSPGSVEPACAPLEPALPRPPRPPEPRPWSPDVD